METQSSKDLEYTTVLASFEEACLSREGREVLAGLPFCHDRQELERRQAVIGDYVRLMSSGMVESPVSFPDITDAIRRLDDIRYSPDGATLYQISTYIRAAERLCAFTKSTLEDKVPMACLVNLFGEGVEAPLRFVAGEIRDTLEPDGTVKPTHPAIAALLKQVESAKQGRISFARQYIHAHREQVQADQGAWRDGRLVIPMRSDRTSKEQGFVNGSSASGNTLFLEPFRLVELNNEVTLAQQQILIETAKILRALSDKVKGIRRSLAHLSGQVGIADSWYALARSAHLGNMHQCQVGPTVKLLMARHPLLGSKAVPITVNLDAKVRAVVLTGPNAGGKTVTIKTVGLLAMINQLCGYIPAKEGSSLPLFDQVLTEIGDGQSIEEGLSTFSGHMHRVAETLRSMTPKSLVVLDELGSGTDPVEGSALARAILEECLACGCLTLVTSHHGVLKEFAYAREDVMNASMAFDEQSHEPTFQVVQGVPGDSHALDTAIRQHIPPRVIDRAKAYLGSSAVQIGEVIKGLEKKRQELDRRELLVKQQEGEIARLKKELQEKELKLRQQRFEIVDSQDTELARYLRNKNKEIEHLLTELRTSGGLTKEQEEKARSVVNNLKSKKEETEHWLDKEERSLNRAQPGRTYSAGDHVLCGTMRRPGIVTKVLKKDTYEVVVGSMRMTMKGRELSPDTTKEEPAKFAIAYTGSTPNPVFEMDVRGLTLEETLRKLDLQIESCLVHGVTQFGIIHGFGDGILSKGVREYLDKHPAVKSHRFAEPNDGGMGKTYVYL